VRFVKSFGQFWYDFIIGDDWKTAAAVVTALALVLVLLATGVFSDTALTLIGAALVMIAFSVSLAIDVRLKSRD
jgi:hypothetical protein